MDELELARRKAEMIRQLTIVCAKIDDNALKGLTYKEFPENMEFQILDGGELSCDIEFALSGEIGKDDLFTDIFVFQPIGNMEMGPTAKGTLMLSVGGDIITLISVDCGDDIERDLPSNIAVQCFKVFPEMPRLEPLTNDEELMLDTFSYMDNLSVSQEDLRQRLRARNECQYI